MTTVSPPDPTTNHNTRAESLPCTCDFIVAIFFRRQHIGRFYKTAHAARLPVRVSTVHLTAISTTTQVDVRNVDVAWNMRLWLAATSATSMAGPGLPPMTLASRPTTTPASGPAAACLGRPSPQFLLFIDRLHLRALEEVVLQRVQYKVYMAGLSVRI